MIVNLWDNTFRHDVGSVADKPPTKIEYVRDRTSWNGITLFVDACAGPGTVRQVQSRIKVGWLHEGPCYQRAAYENVDWDGLDMVLTYYEPFLSHPKARFIPCGGIWIPREHWGMKQKTKLCSMLYSGKTATEGHRLRPRVANEIRDLGVVDFYGVEGKDDGYGWQAKLAALSDYAFSITVNSCYAKNMFSEQLNDCLVVGTIPISWGFPNYDDFFNGEGILGFDNLEEVRQIVQNLSMELYNQMMPAAKDNLKRVKKYEITDDLVADILEGL